MFTPTVYFATRPLIFFLLSIHHPSGDGDDNGDEHDPHDDHLRREKVKQIVRVRQLHQRSSSGPVAIAAGTVHRFTC